MSYIRLKLVARNADSSRNPLYYIYGGEEFRGESYIGRLSWRTTHIPREGIGVIWTFESVLGLARDRESYSMDGALRMAQEVWIMHSRTLECIMGITTTEEIRHPDELDTNS